MKKIFIILVSTVLIASCKQSATLSDEEKETIIHETKSTLTNYYSDIKKSGLMAEFKYLDSSSNFFWVPPGYSSALFYDSVSAVIKRSALNFSLVDNTFDTLSVIPLSKEFVTYTGRLRSVMTDTSGNTNSYTLVETGVLIKKDKDWKLLCGQTNLIQQDNKQHE